MKNKLKHVVIIPARGGSIGFPGKNRLLYGQTSDFIKSSGIFDLVIVTSNDSDITRKAEKDNFEIIKRTDELSANDISINDVLSDVITKKKLDKNCIIWLLYLTIPYKHIDDFIKVKELFDNGKCNSICAFLDVKTHPYDTWYINDDDTLTKYIDNDVFRRQDKPNAYEHHHYICAFRADIVKQLNSELIYNKTAPFFIDTKKAKFMIEIDTKKDYEDWKNVKKLIK